MSNSLWPHGLYSPWNFPSQNTGMGCHALLQGIFPIQGSNPGLPQCRRILYQLSHQGSRRILEWVAYPSSRGSSRPRNPTRVSCTAGGFLTSWAAREALLKISHIFYYLNSKCFYLPFRKLFCLENCRRYSNEIKKKKKNYRKSVKHFLHLGQWKGTSPSIWFCK